MNKVLKEKIRESLSSVLPISIIVLLLSISVAPMPTGTLMLFLTGAFLLIVGMGFFSLGADVAMIPMGEGMGAELTKSKKLAIIIFVGFLLGFVITVAEPSLQVLAGQVPAIPNLVLIITVAAGVGAFLAVAMVRILLRIKLSSILLFIYPVIFILTQLVPDDFVALAFDSGSVATGAITVPFILAIGVGMAAIRGDKGSHDDSFGLVAMCVAGPVLAVLVLGVFYNPSGAEYGAIVLPEVVTSQDVAKAFAIGLPQYLKEVSLALSPVVVFFAVFQLIFKRFTRRQLVKIAIGLIYTFIGLVLFLTGVNVGFLPAGHFLASEIATSAFKWSLLPIGMIIGYFIVIVEPSVHVLVKEVEEITSGAISQKSMLTGLSIGVAMSVGISMLRVLTGISILWFLIPGYAVALGLTFVVPRIFTGIAFDSGGVASGPMSSTFLLPFAIGASQGLGGNVLADAFGIVAMVAMTPLITIQVLGLVYKGFAKDTAEYEPIDAIEVEEEIIEYDEEGLLSE